MLVAVVCAFAEEPAETRVLVHATEPVVVEYDQQRDRAHAHGVEERERVAAVVESGWGDVVQRYAECAPAGACDFFISTFEMPPGFTEIAIDIVRSCIVALATDSRSAGSLACAYKASSCCDVFSSWRLMASTRA